MYIINDVKSEIFGGIFGGRYALLDMLNFGLTIWPPSLINEGP